MNPKPMTTQYKTLIVLTFLIGVFFLTKYIYQAWPRYDLKESLYQDYWDLTSDRGFCQHIVIDPCKNISIFVGWTRAGKKECEKMATTTINICYVREKIRIK